jgi:hypothetical protein
MNHGPFGLSPQVFSIGFLVVSLFYMSWTTAAGARIACNRVDEFFIDTCRRGYEPHFRRTWSTSSHPAWDVTPRDWRRGTVCPTARGALPPLTSVLNARVGRAARPRRGGPFPGSEWARSRLSFV